jgi:tetratricopeptide (TPR) repeat protein
MTDVSQIDVDPAAEIDRCLADLAGNEPAAAISGCLRAIEARLPAGAALRARFLRARAIANQRLGFPTEALGDLYEARRLAEGAKDWRELAEIDRAIAVVQTWRGEGREAALALLRAAAAATAIGDRTAMALAFMQGGRLEIEIGRPRGAELLFSLALAMSSIDLSLPERARATVNLVQALVASGQIDLARRRLDEVAPLLADAAGRTRFLAALEAARIGRATGNRDATPVALRQAEELVPHDPECFERVELAHVEAEVALEEGDPEKAERLLADVITRYGADDLAGPEVSARLLQARALDKLGKAEEAERTLAAALKRAVNRRLSGHADSVRSRLSARGSTGREPLPEAIRTDAADRFVRRRPLGAGGFGNVSRAYDLELGIEVALKRVALESLWDPAVRTRLLDAAKTEIAAASRIEHPGVARIYGMLLDTNGDALIVQELIDGPTLRAAMAQQVEPARALDLLARIGYALAAIHAAGIVHRDLKPDNVILRGATSPVIVDFGIALVGPGSRDVERIGTRSYMAPEQAAGAATDGRADLYALGVIAHELLVGKIPEVQRSSAFSRIAEFSRRPRRRDGLISAGIAPAVADLVAQLLSVDPGGRPDSAAAVGTEFTRAIAKES